MDLETLEWKKRQVKETSRFFHSAVLYDKYWYILGGCTSKQDALNTMVCFHIFDSEGRIWAAQKPKKTKKGRFEVTICLPFKVAPFEGVPTDILLFIFSFLNEVELYRLSLVCRKWQHLSQQDILVII